MPRVVMIFPAGINRTMHKAANRDMVLVDEPDKSGNSRYSQASTYKQQNKILKL